MSRHLFLVLPLLLAGCAQPAQTAQSVPAEPRAYVCRPTGAPGSAPEQRVAVRPDDQRTGVLLQLDGQSGWRALAPLAGSGTPVYADTSYAWRANGSGGVLTDIRNVQTYDCAAGGPVK